VLQFLRRVSQDLLIGKTVEDSTAFHIYDGNHVRRVLADQMKKFFPFEQLPANSVYLQMLINRVQVEQENETNQTSYGLGQHIRCMKIWGRGRIWKQERSQRSCEEKSDDARHGPQPPFAALNLSKVRPESRHFHVFHIARVGSASLLHKGFVSPLCAQ